jgi:adenylyltransferase/sulfurtransferase
VLERKPLVYGSIFRFEGQVTVFDASRGPCYRCLFPAPPPPELAPSCAEGGVLGVLPGMVGTLQANEALKLILGVGEPLVGRLLTLDALGGRFTELRLRKALDCPACGERPTVTELVDYEAFCAGPAAAGHHPGATRLVARPGPASPPPEHRPAAGVPSSSGPVPERPTSDPAPDLPARTSEVTPADVARHLAAGTVRLLDVREPYEWAIGHIDGALLIPLRDLRERLGELSPDQPLVVYCHTGGRSRFAVQALRAAGFERAYNLTGGIDQWSREIDPSLPRY